MLRNNIMSQHILLIQGDPMQDCPARGGLTAREQSNAGRILVTPHEISAEAVSGSTYRSDTLEAVGK
jgi:hypothetical protein